MKKEKIYVQNEHLFKNKVQMIVYLIIFIFLIGMFIYLGSIDYNEKVSDNIRFSNDFSLVPEDNVFKYVNAGEVRKVVSGNKGIVLFGTKNEWVEYYAFIINKVAKEMGIKEVYYYDFIKNRNDNNGTYEDIVEKLSNYVTYNDRGRAEIYAPTLLVASDKEILYFDATTSFVKGKVTPSVYWNTFTQNEKELELKAIFQKYIES